jgi:multidrug resistance protein, MATE family
MAEKLQVDVSYRQIMKIALPISFALLVPNLNFIINNVFLGHLSEEALATASITGVYYLIFTGIGNGLNSGLQMLISRRAGENRPEEIGKLFNQGVITSMLIAAAAIAITYDLAPHILRIGIHDESRYQTALEFLHIRIWGLPFLYIYQMRNALLVGTNQSRYLVAGTLAEAIANIFFDYALIFGRFGFPAMGFNGAAVASIIAEFTGMFVIFAVIYGKGISRRYALFKNLGWDPVNAPLLLRISGPLIFQYAISIVSWWFFFLLVEHQGKTSLAVSNTMRNVFGFFGIFIWAFAATTNTMVSNIIGQDRKDQVIPVIKKIMSLNTGIILIVCLLLTLFPQVFLSIYGQTDAFMEAAVPVMRVVAFAMVLMSVATVWLNAVIGTGNSRITFMIEVLAIVVYCIYVYLVLEVYQLSILWGWMSELIYWSIMFLFSYRYIRRNKWRKLTI